MDKTIEDNCYFRHKKIDLPTVECYHFLLQEEKFYKVATNRAGMN